VEDWEEFFVEKSRRRFDKERSRRQRLRRQSTIAAVVTILLVGAIVALTTLR